MEHRNGITGYWLKQPKTLQDITYFTYIYMKVEGLKIGMVKYYLKVFLNRSNYNTSPPTKSLNCSFLDIATVFP